MEYTWWILKWGLIIWRITAFLTLEDGPFDIFSRFRDTIGMSFDEHSNCTGNSFARLFCCFWCVSIWVSLLVIIDAGNLLDILTVSTTSIIINSVIHGR